jgi:hypothetical protein
MASIYVYMVERGGIFLVVSVVAIRRLMIPLDVVVCLSFWKHCYRNERMMRD